MNDLYGYDHSPSDQYIVCRDGEERFRGTEADCWRFLHRDQSGSVEYALNRAGYTFTPIEKEHE